MSSLRWKPGTPEATMCHADAESGRVGVFPDGAPGWTFVTASHAEGGIAPGACLPVSQSHRMGASSGRYRDSLTEVTSSALLGDPAHSVRAGAIENLAQVCGHRHRPESRHVGPPCVPRRVAPERRPDTGERQAEELPSDLTPGPCPQCKGEHLEVNPGVPAWPGLGQNVGLFELLPSDLVVTGSAGIHACGASPIDLDADGFRGSHSEWVRSRFGCCAIDAWRARAASAMRAGAVNGKPCGLPATSISSAFGSAAARSRPS